MKTSQPSTFRFRVRSRLALGTAAAIACLPTSLWAQTTSDTTSTSVTATSEGQNPAAAKSADGLEEIVVTARKSSENLQRTPISITAFSAERLESQGITQISRIQDFTPNLTFANVPSNSGIASNAAVYIRGIGQSDFAPSVDPGVGTYVDGVYLGRTVGGVFDLVDVASVEVLRGPQGTLFGQNTIGGAINITTLVPDDTFHARGDIKYGSDNRLNVRGVVSGPIADGLYAKLSGGLFSQDGYVDAPNLGTKLGNQDLKTIRGALRYAPAGSAFDITVAADYSRDKSNGAPFVITGFNPLPSSMIALSNFIASGQTDPNFCYAPAQANNRTCYNNRLISQNTNYSTGPTYSDLKLWGVSATVSVRLSETMSLKSITAFRKTTGSFANDPDGSDVFISHNTDIFEQKQFSQELQFNGHTANGVFSWVSGLFYFHEKGKDINPIDFLIVSAQSGGFFNYNTYAAFAQLSVKPIEKLTITGGLRYTAVRKDFLPDQVVFSTLAPFLVIPTGTRIVPFQTVKANVDKLTPMVNVTYQATPDFMVYATFSQGFKGGGYTQRIFPPEPSLPSFQPENVNAYEGGLKLQTWGNRLRVNLAGYYTDYQNLQLNFADASRVGPFIANAGNARIYGFELETTLAPGDGWKLNGSLGMTNAKYTKLAPGVQNLTLDTPFNYVSKWTVSASAEKTLEFGNGAAIVPHVDWSYRSGFTTNSNGINIPDLYQPGYSVFNANVRYTTPNKLFSLTAGADNIGDEKFRTFGDYQPPFGMIRQAFDRGRQYYVKAGFSF